MSVLITEIHKPRRPGILHTGLFPGVCFLVVTVSWGRGTLADAIRQAMGLTRDPATGRFRRAP